MTGDPTSLDRLHDVIAPPPAPWWPPAPGWRWLIGFLSVVAIYTAARAVIHRQRNRYRREALAEWGRQSTVLSNPAARAAALAELAILLKRTALSAFPRARVAALTGYSWLAFLDRTAGKRDVHPDTAALLERAAYGVIDGAEFDEARARQAAAFARDWIVHHRTGDLQGGSG